MPRNNLDGTEQGLTEQGANLYQTPKELDLSFEGDLGSGTNMLRPVNGVSRKPYLPMTFEILPPKIPVDQQTLNSYNAEFQAALNDRNAVGAALAVADGILESDSDYTLALAALDLLPPLVLYINPTDLTRNHTKRVNTQMTTQGHITEHWGDEQVTLSASGKIGAAYTDQTGLTRYFRRNSASYQQLMHLYIMYRNNGYLYETVDVNRIGLVGRVQITYDTESWIGHFDSFSMSENADNPYTMEYSFDFTVREYTNNTTMSTNTNTQRGSNPETRIS